MRLAIFALTLTACAHQSIAIIAPTAAFVDAPAWHSLEAEHHVTLTIRLDNGKTEVRQLRGLIAVQRPDRFRLRALGPAGITLFDLLVKNGRAKTVSAMKMPNGGSLDAIVASLAADLSCAYALSPSAQRSTRLDGDGVLVEEPGRRVRLSRFAGAPATWRRAQIETPRYRVLIEVDHADVDAVLDPALFDD